MEVNAVVLKEHNVLFALYKDITDEKQYEGKLHQLTSETLATTDEVIMKQMRVAQEIASCWAKPRRKPRWLCSN